MTAIAWTVTGCILGLFLMVLRVLQHMERRIAGLESRPNIICPQRPYTIVSPDPKAMGKALAECSLRRSSLVRDQA